MRISDWSSDVCSSDLAAWLESFSPTFAFLGVPGVGLPHADALWRRIMIQTIKSFLLIEFITAHWLTLKYFFKPKATINYPYEKNPISPRFRGEHVLDRKSTRLNSSH